MGREGEGRRVAGFELRVDVEHRTPNIQRPSGTSGRMLSRELCLPRQSVAATGRELWRDFITEISFCSLCRKLRRHRRVS